MPVGRSVADPGYADYAVTLDSHTAELNLIDYIAAVNFKTAHKFDYKVIVAAVRVLDFIGRLMADWIGSAHSLDIRSSCTALILLS